ncbi:MAG: SDR family oxidoreductase [Chloroflexi bacterium]|nr:SDR family oxidoreductase [Chloroflexota bacterium]
MAHHRLRERGEPPSKILASPGVVVESPYRDLVVLITGAGSGIGAATARYLGAREARVALVGRDPDNIGQVAAEIAAGGRRALAVRGDVTSAADMARAVQDTVAAFGRLDAAVANAGTQLHLADRPIHDLDLAAWDRTQDVNSRGVLLTAQAAVRQMLVQGTGGALVLTASVVALSGVAAQNPAYTASKGAVLALGRSIGVQYAKQGIRCNVVCPGSLEQTPDFEDVADPVGRVRARSAIIPMGRLGLFEELAPMIAFLCGPESSYATGGVFVVDGGMTAI